MSPLADITKVLLEDQSQPTRQEGSRMVEKAGDLHEIYEGNAPFVCRTLRRLGIAESDLDDGLQEVFLVVAQLGCPLQTAYSCLHKARERLLEAVRRARQGEEP